MKKLETISCPYCDASNYRQWIQENGYFGVKCNNCELVYVNPRPILSQIDESAQTGLHETDRGRLNVAGGFKRSKVAVLRKRLCALYPDGELGGKQNVRWLDVGAGYGELLIAVESVVARGSEIMGIEPCKPKLDAATRRGLKVINVPLREIPEGFGYISLINVFSHLPDPRRFLSDLRRLLRQDGELIVVTGNGAEIPSDAMPLPHDLPDHLIFAGEKHVRGLLGELGFEIVCMSKYAEFLPEHPAIVGAKNIAKAMLGRPRRIRRRHGPFRSMFFRARLAR